MLAARCLVAIVAAAPVGETGSPTGMNPVDYVIANPTSHSEAKRNHRGEYFEMYGPPRTSQYSGVVWDNQITPLPAGIVARFNDKVMAITGMEVDIVHHAADGSDSSVSCFEQYNHHWTAHMRSKYVKQMVNDPAPVMDHHGRPIPHWVPAGVGSPNSTMPGIPLVQAFSEGNGNEHRVSFKGYAKGFSQLIYSPESFLCQPMIINTNKRLTNDTSPGPIGGPQPRNTLAPPNADYQGILECPCTTRKPKVLDAYLSKLDGGSCAGTSDSPTATECLHAAHVLGLPLFWTNKSGVPGNSTAFFVDVVDDATLPRGCLAQPLMDAQERAWYKLTVNTHRFGAERNVYTAPTDAPQCGQLQGADAGHGPLLVVGAVDVAEAVSMDLRLDPAAGTSTITLTIGSAAAGAWVGVAFNATSMDDEPYAIIADAAASDAAKPKVQERKLGDHNAGVQLPASVKVLSDASVRGKRVLVLERVLRGASASHYSFQANRATLKILVAIGSSGAFATSAVHKTKVALLLPLAPPEAQVCLCRDPDSNHGTIGGRQFDATVCAPFPTSTLLTGSVYGKNGICDILGALRTSGRERELVLDTLRKQHAF